MPRRPKSCPRLITDPEGSASYPAHSVVRAALFDRRRESRWRSVVGNTTRFDHSNRALLHRLANGRLRVDEAEAVQRRVTVSDHVAHPARERAAIGGRAAEGHPIAVDRTARDRNSAAEEIGDVVRRGCASVRSGAARRG